MREVRQQTVEYLLQGARNKKMTHLAQRDAQDLRL